MKINTTKGIYFTSDTHYSHGGICRGTTHWRVEDGEGNLIIPLDAVRDFDTLEEMNGLMIQNINDTVGEDDILFHCGDWSFAGFERIEEFRKQIRCKNIHLILGNHDHHIERNKGGIRRIFSSVNHYLDLRINDINIILCHYPIISWNNMRRGSIMIHGHQHLRGDDRFGNGKRMDVGICGSPEYRPYHLDEIVELLSERVNYEPGGHHNTKI